MKQRFNKISEIAHLYFEYERKKSDWLIGLNHSVLILLLCSYSTIFISVFEKQPRFYHYVAGRRRHNKFVEAEIIGNDPSNLSRFFYFDAFLKLDGPSRPLSDFSSEAQKNLK